MYCREERDEGYVLRHYLTPLFQPVATLGYISTGRLFLPAECRPLLIDPIFQLPKARSNNEYLALDSGFHVFALSKCFVQINKKKRLSTIE